MSPETTSRDFVARHGDVPEMVDFVAALAESAGLDSRRLAHLRIAVEEIALNICDHAYGGGEGRLGISVGGDAERLVTELVDDGPPFDPGAAPKPTLDDAVDRRAVGGLGVFLVQRLMDEFRYRRDEGSNVVTLVVSSNRDGAAA